MIDPGFARLRARIGDRYSFEALLGRGAFAAVYLVRNIKLKRREALKILTEGRHGDAEFAARFVAEATTVASLDHPNIVQVYDYGDADGVLWYSMQYIEGPTLWTERHARRRLDRVTALRIFVPLLEALEFSHQRGVIHRDVKPANILLNQQGRPFLTDFGIAKTSDSAFLTVADKILGTPAYMSPEQAEGKPLDGRSDLYSLALVLYECLAGRQPFEASEPLAQLVQRTQQDPIPIRQFLPEIDEELSEVLMRALARDREQRFTSAQECRRLLKQMLARERRLPPMQPLAPPPAALSLAAATTEVPGPLGEDHGLGTSAITLELSREESARRPPRALRWVASGFLVLSLLVLGWLQVRQPRPAPVEPVPETAGLVESDALPPPPEPLPTASQARSNPEPASVEPVATSPAAQPAASETAPEPIRRAVKIPRLLAEVRPELEGEAAVRCAGERVILSAKVGEDGRVSSVKVLRSGLAECVAAAEAAARQYQFAPATDDVGQPVAASTTLSIEFVEGP